MEQTIEMNTPSYAESAFQRWWKSRSFIQKRLIRFCLSMLTMGVCFPLYYLGLFGGVDGPLNPDRIGEALAGMGVTRTHSMVLFLSLLIMAVSWNWIYNLVSLRIGARLSCKRSIDDAGGVCAAHVKRTRVLHRKTGQPVDQYLCERGHKRPDAHFHPVRKGAVSQLGMGDVPFLLHHRLVHVLTSNRPQR